MWPEKILAARAWMVHKVLLGYHNDIGLTPETTQSQESWG
jgi:hypothetical protein